MNPLEYLEKGQSEFRAFGGNYIKGTVAKLEPAEGGALGWRAFTVEGDEIRAKHVLVSTGITDELPDVPGVEELWGQRIFHCPYCHGYEVRNRRIAVIGGLNPGFTVRMVHLLRKWSPNITFFPNGLSLGETDLKQFAARGIEVITSLCSRLPPILISLRGLSSAWMGKRSGLSLVLWGRLSTRTTSF